MPGTNTYTVQVDAVRPSPTAKTVPALKNSASQCSPGFSHSMLTPRFTTAVLVGAMTVIAVEVVVVIAVEVVVMLPKVVASTTICRYITRCSQMPLKTS